MNRKPDPLHDYGMYTARNAQVAASLLQVSFFFGGKKIIINVTDLISTYLLLNGLISTYLLLNGLISTYLFSHCDISTLLKSHCAISTMLQNQSHALLVILIPITIELYA